MKRTLAIVAAAVAGLLATVAGVATAGGAGKNVATAVNVCSELVSWGAIPASEYDSCRDLLRHGATVAPGPGAPTFMERCAMLEEGVADPFPLQISYPYTFHAGEGDIFPDLTANNRTQCSRALYAFHTIESNAFAGPPQPGPTAGPPMVANAATACATLVSWGAIGEDELGDCKRALAGGANFGPGPGAPTYVERCAMLEQGVTDPFPLKISYPYTFHGGLHDILPDLTAHNRDQCSRALYVFHTLEAYLATL